MPDKSTRWYKIVGSSIIIAIGCIDPGNLIGDIEITQKMGYKSLWVLLLAHVMLFFFQETAIEMALQTGQDLPSQISQRYSRATTLFIWLTTELAIICADVQEILGASIAVKLLFGISELVGMPIVILIVLGVLFVQQIDQQIMELIFLLFVALMALCFCTNFFALRPGMDELLWGFVPSVPKSLEFTAVIGSIIMPQNFVLHTSLVLTRENLRTPKSQLSRLFKIETAVVIALGFLINFFLVGLFANPYYKDKTITLDNAGRHLETFSPRLSALFWAIGLFCAGISSTATGALTGQYLSEGIFHMRISKLKRVLITRLITLLPCALVILYLDVNKIINFLNVVQFMQLPFIIIPLLRFVGSKNIMQGEEFGQTKLRSLVVLSAMLQAINWFSMYEAIGLGSEMTYVVFFVVVVLQVLIMWHLARADINEYQKVEDADFKGYEEKYFGIKKL